MSAPAAKCEVCGREKRSASSGGGLELCRREWGAEPTQWTVFQCYRLGYERQKELAKKLADALLAIIRESGSSWKDWSDAEKQANSALHAAGRT